MAHADSNFHRGDLMATVFTKIINGEFPGAFVWRDDVCVSFLSINPISRGHALVIPIVEVDEWTDLPAETAAHLMTVAHHVGRAQKAAFAPVRIGQIIAGFEVPHAHVHVIAINGMNDLDFANAAATVDREDLENAADAIVEQLQAAGHTNAGR